MIYQPRNVNPAQKSIDGDVTREDENGNIIEPYYASIIWCFI